MGGGGVAVEGEKGLGREPGPHLAGRGGQRTHPEPATVEERWDVLAALPIRVHS